MTSTDTTLRAANAVFVAERAAGRARRVVEDIQTTITSALRVLDDAELDSAKARLTDRGDFYLEAASEHLGRLQTRCNEMPELTRELFGHLNRASESLNEARGFLDLADTSDPIVAGDVAQLKPRIAVVGEMVALAKPVAQLAAQHVDSARRASQDITPPALLEPVTLDRSIRTAGKELGRADEDARLLGEVVDHAATSAQQSAGIAAEISDNARRRMSEHGRDPAPASPPRSPTTPAAGCPSTAGTRLPAPPPRPPGPRLGRAGGGRRGPRPGRPAPCRPRARCRRPRPPRPGRRPDRTARRRPDAVAGDGAGLPGRPDHARLLRGHRPGRGVRAGHQRRRPNVRHHPGGDPESRTQPPPSATPARWP